MKFHALIFIVLSCIVAFDCKNDSPASQAEDPQVSLLYGSWDWFLTEGGLAHQSSTPQSVGYYVTKVFDREGIVQTYHDYQLVSRTPFTIKKKSSDTVVYYVLHYQVVSADSDHAIQYQGNDTLRLWDEGIADGFIHSYARIRE